MAIEAELRKAIAAKGFVSIEEMMRIALSSNLNSYYRAKQPIGEGADFITAPEVSQMFGEMIGIWCTDIWIKLGKPNEINIVEFGPGRGTLMKDLLRATKHIDNFHSAVNIGLFEISEALTELQKDNLKGYKITWYKDFYNIPKKPTIFIANEFFDALPIRQFEKEKNKWYEKILTTDPIKGILRFDRIPLKEMLEIQLNLEHTNAQDGAIVEESLESIEYMQLICDHLAKFNGAVLVIDYGYNINPAERGATQYNPTLQALKKHKYHPVLDSIGEADLTSHVNFYNLKKVADARKLKTFGAISQGEFLDNIGIKVRLEMLKQQATLEEQVNLEKQYNRLTSPEHMGTLFKAFSVVGDLNFLPFSPLGF